MGISVKMSFNPDPNKKGQEFIFPRNFKRNHPSLNFNNMMVTQSTTHKHQGMILDTKLEFLEHLKDKLNKISKANRLLRMLQKIFNRPLKLTICKFHLDYGNIIYDKAYD